jgi:DNA (cytosine-5)-methyltransferase 1
MKRRPNLTREQKHAKKAYYNEINPFAADWLRNLIAAGLIASGDVDERSIADVRPGDLRGYTQCHFFAGIGGWSLALRLAGWPDDRPVWTGSCPCQVLSSAARGRNVAADLWPAWLPLIAANRPRKVFGEQVDHKSTWFDRVCNDLESLGYEVGAAVLPAVSVGKDHTRPRIYFVGHSDRDGKSGMRLDGEVAGMCRHRSDARGVVPAHGLPPRMAVFSAFGNAIVPQVAAEFIMSAVEVFAPYARK